MNPDALFLQPSQASADASGIALAGDTLALATSQTDVLTDGRGSAVGVSKADALASDLDGLDFELAGVSTLAVAGSVLGEEFSAGSAATFAVMAGPGGIDLALDTTLAIGFGEDVSVGSSSAVMPDFSALSMFG